MKTSSIRVAWARLFTLAVCLLALNPTLAADSELPKILQAGFTLWSRGGADIALDSWIKGGLMENETARATELSNYFKTIDRSLGNFKSPEWVEEKQISKTTQIVYLAINFDRGVVFGKFVIYHGGANWIVQDMVFNTHPEAIMPWLAIEGTKSSQ